MTLKEFITKYQGKEIDFDGFYAGQCVDLFRQYVKEVLNKPQPRGVTGAADFWANYSTDPNLYNHYEQIANTPEFIPKEGDVAVFNKRLGNGFGHISVCTGKGNTSTFESFDQNWSKISFCEIVTHNYNSLYGVLRPKGGSLSDYYKGLDLTNKESMKVCVDTWKDVQDGKYLRKEDVDKLKEEWGIKFTEVEIDLGEEKEARKRDIIAIAGKLGISNDLVEILKEIEKLIVAEEARDKCLDDKRNCEQNSTQKATELKEIYENLSLLSGYSVASPKGVERAMQAYAKLHQIAETGDIKDFRFIIKLFGALLWRN